MGSGAGFSTRHYTHQTAYISGRAFVTAGKVGQRIDSAGEKKAGRTQLWLGRHGHFIPPVGGIILETAVGHGTTRKGTEKAAKLGSAVHHLPGDVI